VEFNLCSFILRRLHRFLPDPRSCCLSWRISDISVCTPYSVCPPPPQTTFCSDGCRHECGGLYFRQGILRAFLVIVTTSSVAFGIFIQEIFWTFLENGTGSNLVLTRRLSSLHRYLRKVVRWSEVQLQSFLSDFTVWRSARGRAWAWACQHR
jgi:hypothetical protein